eukprot:TRINITY_DN17157_c1_g2_i1.p1 TRINITY_DN17157_c1_g2~~TRINITY_DN17157_c1_g2_i1.p1  ORF type:complete len:312 (-),score=32.76 TRINITY_DN17157_c1_g2_i1:460-1395(-)
MYSSYGSYGPGGYTSIYSSGYSSSPSFPSVLNKPSGSRYNEYSSRYSDYSIYQTPNTYRSPLLNPSRGAVINRGNSLPPTLDARKPPMRGSSVVRREMKKKEDENHRNIRLKSPSIPRERTRDELIDSIIHTRTKEHRVMPGFRSTSDFDERRNLKVDCDKVFDGIIIGNGETICNLDYLKGIGVSHVLNTAEHHVVVNPSKYNCYNIKYYGFHVDDLPGENISRYFHRTTDFIDKAVKSGGLVVVNCVMGWSRSATCVAAYLMMKHGMTATRAVETIRQSRPIRPNAGFLQQLADLENTLSKRISLFWKN